MLNIETKELKISDKLKRKIEIIGRFTNTTPIINNGYVKNITGTIVFILSILSFLLKNIFKLKIKYNQFNHLLQ